MSLKPTPGTVTGTKIIVFQGGPPGWEGSVDACLKTCESVERWDYVADSAIVFRRTGCTEDVPIVREKRTGQVTEMKVAEVFAFAGYKDEL